MSKAAPLDNWILPMAISNWQCLTHPFKQTQRTERPSQPSWTFMDLWIFLEKWALGSLKKFQGFRTLHWGKLTYTNEKTSDWRCIYYEKWWFSICHVSFPGGVFLPKMMDSNRNLLFQGFISGAMFVFRSKKQHFSNKHPAFKCLSFQANTR